jgi:hypothetical protein
MTDNKRDEKTIQEKGRTEIHASVCIQQKNKSPRRRIGSIM